MSTTFLSAVELNGAWVNEKASSLGQFGRRCFWSCLRVADQRVTISQRYTVTRDYSSEYCVTTNFLEADFWPAGMSGPNPDARRVITSLIIHDLGQQAERAGSELYTCCAYYVHVNGARIRSFVDNSGVRGNPSLKFLGCAFF